MKRLLDVLTVALLLVALAQAVWLFRAPPAGSTALVLLPGTPEELAAPVGVRAATARVSEVGELVTIEDLARLALALQAGEVEGLPELTPAQRDALLPVVERAMSHRDALLEQEAALRAAEADLDAAAADVLGALDPAQQRWLLDHRDELSVSGVEDRYWRELAASLQGGR